MLKENKGVTLVALVITIIVLLILAGVTLSMVMGDSGIFSKANKASTETTISSAKDAVRLATLEAVTDQYDDNGATTTANEIKNDNVVKKVGDKLQDGYSLDGTSSPYTIKQNGKDTGVTVSFSVGSNHSVTPTFNK